MKKIIRTSTIALSLNYLLKGQLRFLQQHFQIVAVSGADEHLLQVAEREKVATVSLCMERKISPLKDIRSLFQLYFLFRKEKPLIVHSITPKAGLLTMMAGYFAGVPIRMHTFTGLIFPSRKGVMQKLLIAMDKILCYCATNIYPEGQGVKADLMKYNITGKELKIIANGNVNGIDLSSFNAELFSDIQKKAIKSDLGIGVDEFVFIFVGRLVGDKGINELIEAFERLSVEVENVRLLLVGPFEVNLDPLSTKAIQQLNSSEQIISVGFQNDVRPYLAISDCLAFPSYREGFPNVVLQAGAMDLPSIVTNISGCNEIIINGENGIIIPVKNSDALYEAMKKMVKNVAFRLQLKKQSRQMIALRYNQQEVWNAILAEYKMLEEQSGFNKSFD